MGSKRYVVTAGDQFSRERVISQATAAIHLSRAACKIKNLHLTQFVGASLREHPFPCLSGSPLRDNPA